MINVFKRTSGSVTPRVMVAVTMTIKTLRLRWALSDIALRLSLGPEIWHAMFAGVTL